VRYCNDDNKAQHGLQWQADATKGTREMILGLRMPPKLANGVRRVALMAPIALIARIDHWRRHQADVPNLSEAIRRLIEMGLETGERHDKKPKPKP
jgi:hypothetical protein